MHQMPQSWGVAFTADSVSTNAQPIAYCASKWTLRAAVFNSSKPSRMAKSLSIAQLSLHTHFSAWTVAAAKQHAHQASGTEHSSRRSGRKPCKPIYCRLDVGLHKWSSASCFVEPSSCASRRLDSAYTSAQAYKPSYEALVSYVG